MDHWELASSFKVILGLQRVTDLVKNLSQFCFLNFVSFSILYLWFSKFQTALLLSVKGKNKIKIFGVFFFKKCVMGL